MSAPRALVLLSGGLDSAVNLLFAVREFGAASVCAVTFDYGQRAREPELRAAKALCRHYELSPDGHEVLALPWLGALGGNALTASSQKLPEPMGTELDHHQKSLETARAVWVPNRNGAFINIAAALAEARGIDRLIVGFNREEAATFPDNSEAYLERVNRSLELSTANHARVVCFTTRMDKPELLAAALASDPGFPLDTVWSCYTAGPQACGKCESCQRFARARASVKSGVHA